MTFPWILFALVVGQPPAPLMGFPTEASCNVIRGRVQFLGADGKPVPLVCSRVERT